MAKHEIGKSRKMAQFVVKARYDIHGKAKTQQFLSGMEIKSFLINPFVDW